MSRWREHTFPSGPEAGAQGVPDALFPTDNEYGIPLLREDMQATMIQAPIMVFEATHHVKMAGTHFSIGARGRGSRSSRRSVSNRQRVRHPAPERRYAGNHDSSAYHGF